MSKNNVFIFRLTAFVVLVLLQGQLWAKDVVIQPSITASLDYSDNIELENSNEKDDFILRITPAISFKRAGSRVKSSLDYSLTGLLHASESDRNRVQHRLAASADSEIIKHSIFLDLDAGISQQLLDPNTFASSDGVSGAQNLTETYTYGFSPSWQKQWGNYADSILRYDYNEVKFSGSVRDDSQSETMSLGISSGRIFNLITWDLDYAHSETHYDNNETTISNVTTLKLGYQYSKQLEFRLITGYEDYESSVFDPGASWAVGFLWTPSPRNTLNLEIGHRFFGDTYKLDFQHRARRFTWNLSYNENITNLRNQIRENIQDLQNTPNNIIAPVATNINQADFYISRAVRSNLSYAYSKSTITWGIYHERRFFSDVDNQDEENYGTNLLLGWRVGRRTTMNTRLLWAYSGGVSNNDQQTRTELSLSLNRRISPEVSGFLRISRQQNNADIKTNEYTENRISVGLTKQF